MNTFEYSNICYTLLCECFLSEGRIKLPVWSSLKPMDEHFWPLGTIKNFQTNMLPTEDYNNLASTHTASIYL